MRMLNYTFWERCGLATAILLSLRIPTLAADGPELRIQEPAEWDARRSAVQAATVDLLSVAPVAGARAETIDAAALEPARRLRRLCAGFSGPERRHGAIPLPAEMERRPLPLPESCARANAIVGLGKGADALPAALDAIDDARELLLSRPNSPAGLAVLATAGCSALVRPVSEGPCPTTAASQTLSIACAEGMERFTMALPSLVETAPDEAVATTFNLLVTGLNVGRCTTDPNRVGAALLALAAPSTLDVLAQTGEVGPDLRRFAAEQVTADLTLDAAAPGAGLVARKANQVSADLAMQADASLAPEALALYQTAAALSRSDAARSTIATRAATTIGFRCQQTLFATDSEAIACNLEELKQRQIALKHARGTGAPEVIRTAVQAANGAFRRLNAAAFDGQAARDLALFRTMHDAFSTDELESTVLIRLYEFVTAEAKDDLAATRAAEQAVRGLSQPWEDPASDICSQHAALAELRGFLGEKGRDDLLQALSTGLTRCQFETPGPSLPESPTAVTGIP